MPKVCCVLTLSKRIIGLCIVVRRLFICTHSILQLNKAMDAIDFDDVGDMMSTLRDITPEVQYCVKIYTLWIFLPIYDTHVWFL